MGDEVTAMVTAQELLSHIEWARRLARALVRHEHDAEDLLQDAWVDAIRHPPDNRGPVKPWIKTVLQRASVRFVARERRRRMRDAATLATANVTDSSEAMLLRLEEHKRLAQYVSELPEIYRQTLLLRFYDDKNATQIGEALGIPAGTVRWRLKQGLAMLQEKLRADHPEQPLNKRLGLLGLAAERQPPKAAASLKLAMMAAPAAIAVATGYFVFAEASETSTRPQANRSIPAVTHAQSDPPKQKSPTATASAIASATCPQNFRSLLAEVEAIELEARKNMRPAEVFAQGTDAPKAQAQLAPVVERIMKGAHAEAPPYTLTCRTWACFLSVLKPEGTSHQRTNEWMLPLQQDPEMKALSTSFSFRDGGTLRDPLSGALVMTHKVFITLRHPETLPREPTPNPQACEAALYDLQEQRERAEETRMKTLPPHLRFAKEGHNSTLTAEVQGMFSRAMGPAAAEMQIACRGQVCRISGDKPRESWEPGLHADKAWRESLKSMLFGFDKNTYMHFKTEEEMETVTAAKGLLDEAMASFPAAHCKLHAKGFGSPLSVVITYPPIDMHFDGDAVGTPYHRCLMEVLDRAFVLRLPDRLGEAEFDFQHTLKW